MPAGEGGLLISLLNKRGLQIALLTILLVLFWGVWSWVQFGQSVGGERGLYTQSDFPAVTIVSRMASEGRGADMYSLDAQLDGQRRLIRDGYVGLALDQDLKYPYPYAPFIAVILSPLSGLDPLAAWLVWDLANLIGMAVGLWYLLSSLALPRNTRLILMLGGLASFPFVVNLEQGQSSGVVMLALGVGLGMLKHGKDLPGGLALGLLALKIQWLPFLVLVLLWKRQWRALSGMLATGLALVGVTALAIGWGWVPGYLDMLVLAQSYARELLLDPWYSHSLAGGVTALIGGGTDSIIRTINLVTMIGAAGLLLWLWRGKWDPRESRWDGLMALTLLAAMLTNPQLNTHDLCLLALPGALGLSYLIGKDPSREGRTVIYWYSIMWGAFIVTSFFLPQVFTLPVRLSTLAILIMGWILARHLSEKSPQIPPKTIPSANTL